MMASPKVQIIPTILQLRHLLSSADFIKTNFLEFERSARAKKLLEAVKRRNKNKDFGKLVVIKFWN